MLRARNGYVNPVCFHIGSLAVYWYGVLVACGFLLSVLNWSLLARRDGLPAGFGSDLGFWIMIGGILCARVSYVAANWSEYAADPITVLRIDLGGLIYYGGFVGGVLAVVLFARVKKVPMWRLGDLAITSVPLGHALGRVGCFVNGCCFGTPWDGPLAVTAWEALRHPTQLYEAAVNLAIYGVLLWTYCRRPRPGVVLALYLTLYSIARFFLEFLRGDPRQLWLGLSVAQHISILFFATGCLLWARIMRQPRDTHA